MTQFNKLFEDKSDHDEFDLLPETALGTPLVFPDGHGRICRRIFPYTAVMVVQAAEMTGEEMRLSRTEEIREEFWTGEWDE
jgi:hypothetical protein